MRNRSWFWISFPLVVLFTAGFLINYWGDHGDFPGFFAGNQIGAPIYSQLRRFSGWATDMKFRLRGPQKARNKIIIASIDTASIRMLGRWPWHRDEIARVLNAIAAAGPKAIGIDILAPERDPRVSPAMREALKKHRLESIADTFETDPALIQTLHSQADRLVLGIFHRRICRPAYEPNACLSIDPVFTQAFKEGFSRFALTVVEKPASFDFTKTPLPVSGLPVFNFPEIQAAAKHMGDFDVELDPDGVMRSTTLFQFANETPFPSFALELARVATGDEIKVTLNQKSELESLGFVKSGKLIPVNSRGRMEINFRGPDAFPELSVADLLSPEDRSVISINRLIGLPFDCHTCRKINGTFETDKFSAEKKELLKDAIVLLGVTAPRYDENALPFDPNAPGILGHAMALDNILSTDALISDTIDHGWIFILLFLTLGGLGAGWLMGVLPAKLAPWTCLLGFSGFTFFDLKILFGHQRNWNTGFVYLEYLSITVLVMINKYVIEEGRRKFLKDAFSKFVSPQVVKTIIADPKKLALGGTRKELTILFSDIRNFMPLCERLNPQALLSFLKDYHEMITKIIFENGTLDKYVGDAIVAFWGAPLDQPSHAHYACDAAIRIFQGLAQANPHFEGKYGVTVNIGIGINTGPVTVGNVGSDRALSYTAIGDDVNLASRVERLTRYYGANILATRATLDSIRASGRSLPPHRMLDRVKVVGAKQAVEVAQILDKKYPLEALDLFQSARQHYQNRQWDEAIDHFKRSEEITRSLLRFDDLPCQVLVEQSRKFKASPPPENWDGSWEMITK